MYDPERPEVYEALGQEALVAIKLALAGANKPVVNCVLDLPSGYGTVLRHLKAEYQDARLGACDIDHQAVDFCAETFGAEPIYGSEHPRDVVLQHPWDLIWCGSLLTHLDAPMWHEFLDFFEQALAPWGVLAFTFHGRPIEMRLRSDVGDHYIGPEQRAAILNGYERDGFGFAEYPTTPKQREERAEPTSYGISLSRPSWVWSLLEQRPLRPVAYREARWGMQDVVGLMKRG